MLSSKGEQRLPHLYLDVTELLADTGGLTVEEFGALLALMFAYWQSGCSLKNDDKVLARLVKVSRSKWSKKIKLKLAQFFNFSDEIISHPGLNACREEALEKCRKNKERAQTAANVRWGNNDAYSNAPSMPESKQIRNKEEGIKENETSIGRQAAAGSDGYKFKGKIVRLTHEDYKKWKEAYPSVSLLAELNHWDRIMLKMPLEQKDWFHIVSAGIRKLENQIRSGKLNEGQSGDAVYSPNQLRNGRLRSGGPC